MDKRKPLKNAWMNVKRKPKKEQNAKDGEPFGNPEQLEEEPKKCGT